MYLQLGAETSVRVKDIIGIFSFNTTFCCADSNEFLKISDEDGFVLTIQANQEDQGALAVISRIIGRFASINTVVTTVDPKTDLSNIIISLKGDCSHQSLEKIITRIERKNYKILSVGNTKSIALS